MRHKLDISLATQLLSTAGIENPAFEARLLLAHVLGLSREQLLLQKEVVLDAAQQQEFEALITRRAKREPMSQLLGKREFYGREFIVTKDVLDPRPDTETLIEAVLSWQLTVGSQQLLVNSETNDASNSLLPTANCPLPTILDIGTGSGCIIITLLKQLPYAHGVAVDISSDAIKVAKANAAALQVDDRLRFVQADMRAIDTEMLGNFDIIVSNPPYIAEQDISELMPEVRDFEPHLALDGGKDGLDFYRILAKKARNLLKPEGLIFLEIGDTQATEVVALFNAAGMRYHKIIKDLAGRDRCVMFQYH